MELMFKQETCWNAVWLPEEELQEQEPKWDLVRERKHQPKKFEDTKNNNLLKQNILNTVHGLITRFLISLTWGRSRRDIMSQDGGFLPSRQTCLHKTWISDELPNGSQKRDEIFSTLISKQHSYKDNFIIWTVMLCVKCHQKQVILRTLLQDWRNLHMAWMMRLDDSGICLTRHCAVMVWFLRELTDAVMYYTQ